MTDTGSALPLCRYRVGRTTGRADSAGGIAGHFRALAKHRVRRDE
jgi:hypothetical protein